jgi:hypothetical protein
MYLQSKYFNDNLNLRINWSQECNLNWKGRIEFGKEEKKVEN